MAKGGQGIVRGQRCLGPYRPQTCHSWGLFLAIIVAIGVIEPVLNPPAAAACFFWQSCARQRGQASNTRAGGKRTRRLMGGNDASIPYVISPRNGWIQKPGPGQPYTIRWNPVANTQQYTVRIWRWTFERDRPEVVLWQGTTQDSSLGFPQQVSLSPGNYYSIEVVTDHGISSDLDEGYYESGFQLLFDEDYGELSALIRDISPTVTPTLEVLPEDVALARAGVFFLEEMYSDALTILQTLTEDSAASDLVYTALGDTYTQSGLTQLALEAYQQALALAIVNGDDLSEASNRVNLGDIYATLGRFDESLQQLHQARDTYEKLNNTTAVDNLERRINVLSTRLVNQRPSP